MVMTFLFCRKSDKFRKSDNVISIKDFYEYNLQEVQSTLCMSCHYMDDGGGGGGLSHFPPKFKNIFVVVIAFLPFLLCKKIIIPACCLLCVL